MAHVEQTYENKTGGARHDGQYPAKYDGVYGECPAPPQHDLASIEPNDTRPASPHKAKHLFKGWSD